MMALALSLTLAAQAGCPMSPPPGEGWRDEVNPIETIPPVYTEAARVFGSRAVCWVGFNIDEAGRPYDLCTRCNAVIDQGPTPEMTERAHALALEHLTGASAAAVRSWRFAEEHYGYRCSRAAFHFHLESHDASELPEPPVGQACMERPQS